MIKRELLIIQETDIFTIIDKSNNKKLTELNNTQVDNYVMMWNVGLECILKKINEKAVKLEDI
jgi:hypothetical protein